ncbi:hypothetical protein ZIOFF_071715 [Zingiber officinale]|uniref:Uncharacterized protein n=1 Tax=Zingiber officinale TaxID=94328 RepID=A0A8J5C449_ZINOF|nr:hypothetical protein ZIOFF_071715 [Zingiber officinale]
MVKFSKQFQGQLVPEWKEAFVDYWQLKKDLKRMHVFNANNGPSNMKPQPAFARRLVSQLRKLPLFGPDRHKDHEAIQAWHCLCLCTSSVHKKLTISESRGVMYETELLEEFADTDAAKDFFARLDLQLNKVNKFYSAKEKEFLERGESLKKQMEILLELQAALKNQRGRISSTNDAKDDSSISCSISCEEDSTRSTKVEEEQDQPQEILSSELERSPFGYSDSGDSEKVQLEEVKLRSLSARVFSCQGKNLKIKIPLTTPSRTFSALAYLFMEDFGGNQARKCGPHKLNINKTKLHHAEKMIKRAFIELYKGLNYLKSYRTLNMLAFVKILKKFDKVTGKEVLNIYLKVVESSYFNSSDMAMKLMDEVEELFAKHFADDDKRKAMKYLKPHQRTESHSVTFFIGLFTGCFIALFVGYCIMAHIAGMYTGQSDTIYMETVYPVLRQMFLIVLFCPVNIIYKSSRYCFLRVIRNIILSPLYKVVMVDFFMADQLCSQVPMLRNMEYVACYYITGSYRTQDYGLCMRSKHCKDLAYAVSFLPYYWRAMQCARRWFDEGETSHLINLGKYVSAMLAAGAKVAYEKEKSAGWLALLVVISSAATVYQLYWDFVKDWGLLQLNSKNRWLRNELILRCKFVYYLSMALNFVLRVAWLQTVLHYNFASLDYRVTSFFLAALEVIRRGHWNFYRLENEHLNNAGKFRAVKTVPLPFHEVDQD